MRQPDTQPVRSLPLPLLLAVSPAARLVLAALLALGALPAASGSASANSASTEPPSVSAPPPRSALALSPERLRALPGASDPAVLGHWRRATGFEEELRFEEAATAYRSLIPALPGSAAPHWRIARAYWRLGDGMPRDDAEAKVFHYGRAADWAQRGIALDERCAECMLWNYAALGRLTMTEGLMSGLRRARTMQRMLDQGIALQPTHRDNEFNSTLGNLYYARAIWNRMVPEWWFLPLLAGVKGDKEQALVDIERAVALNGGRIDYQVEKGAVLLCLGTDRKRPERVDEGKRVLRDAMSLDERLESDAKDLAFARVLLREPDKACGYSREGFVDIEGARKEL